MAFPGAKWQCLESPFSRCSDLSTECTVFGEWKPLVSPMSGCGSMPAVPCSSPLWLATNFIKGWLEGLWASDSFLRVSPSPGGLGWLKREYLSSDNEGPLVVPSSSFSLPGSDSSEWTMTSASTWLLHTDVHRQSSKSCNKTMSLLIQVVLIVDLPGSLKRCNVFWLSTCKVCNGDSFHRYQQWSQWAVC